jgi:hypothetical protein
MKKTLLIAAAALAAGVISSQAQSSVYSQNIVGYVNIPVTAGQFSLQAPPLDLDGTGTNNTLSTVYPNPAIGDSVYIFSGGAFSTYGYSIKAASHGNPAVTNWFDGTGAVAGSTPLNVGASVFYLPVVNETNVFVGQVLAGSVTNKFTPSAGNFGLVSQVIPVAGGITTVLNYQPAIGDTIYTFNGSYSTYSYSVKAASHGNPAVTNWFDGTGAVDEPQISVGQGFWLNPVITPVWSQTLTNN